MLQPKNLLMKRGTLLGRESRVDREVFSTIGFPNFIPGIAVVFSEYCPATVSDSETVFLCPSGSSVAALQPLRISQPIVSTYFSPTVAATTGSAQAGSRRLRADPKRRAVSK